MPPILRSWLFVPGNRPERFDKALRAGADAVIVDLEDAVAPPDKEAARATVGAWLDTKPLESLRSTAANARNADAQVSPDPQLSRVPALVVRINGADTSWFADDLALAAKGGLHALMIPKAERAGTLAAVVDAGARAVVPMIESASGFAALPELCAAAGVERLAFGNIDFQVDLGMRDAHEDELLYFRSRIVLESRLAGLAAPIDGVCTAIDDAARLATDVQRARRLGFGAKLCIHPRQVAQVNSSFAPSDEERAWARRVLDAAAAAGGAAVAVDGKMVDKPVMLRAEAILREAGGGSGNRSG